MSAFDQRLANALGNAALHLALNNHRIDDGAEVINRRIACDLGEARIRINFHFANVNASREHEIRRIME